MLNFYPLKNEFKRYYKYGICLLIDLSILILVDKRIKGPTLKLIPKFKNKKDSIILYYIIRRADQSQKP